MRIATYLTGEGLYGDAFTWIVPEAVLLALLRGTSATRGILFALLCVDVGGQGEAQSICRCCFPGFVYFGVLGAARENVGDTR